MTTPIPVRTEAGRDLVSWALSLLATGDDQYSDIQEEK